MVGWPFLLSPTLRARRADAAHCCVLDCPSVIANQVLGILDWTVYFLPASLCATKVYWTGHWTPASHNIPNLTTDWSLYKAGIAETSDSEMKHLTPTTGVS